VPSDQALFLFAAALPPPRFAAALPRPAPAAAARAAASPLDVGRPPPAGAPEAAAGVLLRAAARSPPAAP